MRVFAGEDLQRDFKKMLTLSLLFHLLIFLPLFLISMKRSTIIIYSSVYTVDLVEPPGKSKARKEEVEMKEARVREEKKKSELKRKKEMEALQEKLELLQKKKVFEEQKAMADLSARVEALKAKKSREILSDRVKQMEEKARQEEKAREKEKTENLIDDIQKKLAALRKSRNNRQGGSVNREPGNTPTHGGLSGREALLMSPAVKAYLNVLDETVRGAWNVPRALIDNREDLMVQLRITIEENGDISSIIVERPSGNRPFDESVLRAINKAAPLPVPPESLKEGKDYYEVGFRFHYFPDGRSGG